MSVHSGGRGPGHLSRLAKAAGSAASTDALATKLAALEAAGKLVCSYFLPTSNPSQYLTLAGSNVTGWAAAYGTQKVDLTEVTVPPTWDATLFSNKGGVVFNAQYLTGTGNVTNWPDATSDMYMLVAYKHTLLGGANNRSLFSYGGGVASDNVGRSLRINDTGAGAATGRAFVAGTTVSSATEASGAHTLGLVCDIGGTSSLYQDGVSVGTAATATAALTLTRVGLGRNPNSTVTGYAGTIACAAILNSTASLTDFTDLEALMRARVS